MLVFSYNLHTDQSFLQPFNGIVKNNNPHTQKDIKKKKIGCILFPEASEDSSNLAASIWHQASGICKLFTDLVYLWNRKPKALVKKLQFALKHCSSKTSIPQTSLLFGQQCSLNKLQHLWWGLQREITLYGPHGNPGTVFKRHLKVLTYSLVLIHCIIFFFLSSALYYLICILV